jgi:hypothetical protein
MRATFLPVVLSLFAPALPPADDVRGPPERLEVTASTSHESVEEGAATSGDADRWPLDADGRVRVRVVAATELALSQPAPADAPERSGD